MRIVDTCSCGGAFEIDDMDNMACGIRHQSWLSAHKPCRAEPNSWEQELAPDAMERAGIVQTIKRMHLVSEGHADDCRAFDYPDPKYTCDHG